MLPRRRELSPGFLTQYWAENEMPTFMWMMPPRRVSSPNTGQRTGRPLSLVDGAFRHPTFPLSSWSCSLTSMRRSQLLLFWGIRGSLRCVVLTPNILGFAAHLRSPHTG
jgi:hypothetical protein